MTQHTAPRSVRVTLNWFAHEVAYLRSAWSGCTAAQIAAHLRRSRESVRKKAGELGIRKPNRIRRWTAERRAQFIAAYDRSLVSACREFGLSPHTARQYRREFCTAAQRRRGMKWTTRERDLLRQLYPAGRMDDLLRMLPHRSPLAVQLAASRYLGPTQRRRLQPQEAAFIRAQYGRTATAAIAEALAMNRDQIRAHARRLGVAKPQPQPAPEAAA